MVSFLKYPRAIATASVLSAALLAAPAFAQTAPQTTAPSQAQAPAAKAAKTAPGSPTRAAANAKTYSTPERVEARIEDLHAKLGITQAQEPQWKQLAEVMRDNAKAIEDKAAEREKAMQTMTVMDDLRSYEALAKTNAEGLTKLVSAFEPLYTSMSPDQKKKADAEFAGYRKRAGSATATQ